MGATVYAVTAELSTLAEALEGSSRPADTLQQILLELAYENTRAQVIVSAIWSERRISRSSWVELVETLELAAPQAVAEDLRSWCRHHLLEGPDSQYHLPLGRVVEYETFCEFLASHPQLTVDGAKALVLDLLHESRWERGRARCKKLGLGIGRYVVWATFSAVDSGDPFDFATTAEDVERGLGLVTSRSLSDPDPRGRSILLLRYEPTDVGLLFPTCAEAGASDPWNYYFQPAPPGAPWGMTKAWGDHSDTTQFKPEIVHEPTPLAGLCGPIEEWA